MPHGPRSMPLVCRYRLLGSLMSLVLLLACTGGRGPARRGERPVDLTEEEQQLQQQRQSRVDQIREELSGAREEVEAEREAHEQQAEAFAAELPPSPLWTFRGTVTVSDGDRLVLEDGRGNRRELSLDAKTVLAGTDGDRPLAETAPVRPGAEVRASYVLERDGLVARRIELIRSAGNR